MTNVVVHEMRDVSVHLDVCCLCRLCILLVMPPSFDSSFAHNFETIPIPQRSTDMRGLPFYFTSYSTWEL